MQIEIISAISDCISKQQLNFSLFLSDWYCQKLGLTHLRSHNRKVMSDKKMISTSCQSCKGGNCCCQFWLNFEITSKFVILFVRLILRKLGFDGFTGPRRKIEGRYEFGLIVILKGLGVNRDFCSCFWLNF